MSKNTSFTQYRELLASIATDSESDSTATNSNSLPNVSETFETKMSIHGNSQQSRRNSETFEQDFEEITPKEAIDLIKEFDGKNIGVEAFISSIEDVRQQVTRQDYLRRLIIAKRIIGDAERELQEYDIGSYDKLYEGLRILFGNLQPVSVFRDKRSRIFQGKLETVSKFTNRFLEVQNQVLAVLANSTVDEQKRQFVIEYEREQGLEQYLLGLRKEISSEVRAQRPSNIRSAIAKAQASEAYDFTRETMTRSLNLAERHSSAAPPRNAPSTSRPHTHSSATHRQQVSCNYCHIFGHIERDCRKKSRDLQNRNNSSIQQSGFQRDRPLPRPPPGVNHVQEEPTSEEETEENYQGLTPSDQINEYSNYQCQEPDEQADFY